MSFQIEGAISFFLSCQCLKINQNFKVPHSNLNQFFSSDMQKKILFQQEFHPSLLRPFGSKVDIEAKFYVILFTVINAQIGHNFSIWSQVKYSNLFNWCRPLILMDTAVRDGLPLIKKSIFYYLLRLYSRVSNKHSPMLINFLTFFQGLGPYSRLHRAYFSSIQGQPLGIDTK